LVSTVARAESTASILLQLYDSGDAETKRSAAYGVSMVETGTSWANTAIANERKEQPIYCPPAKLALTGDQLIDIIRREVSDHPSVGTAPFGLVMIKALEKLFPCGQKSN
jgi:hypothetical protein